MHDLYGGSVLDHEELAVVASEPESARCADRGHQAPLAQRGSVRVCTTAIQVTPSGTCTGQGAELWALRH
eukprot:849426-Rhodomonas_salina.2